MPINHYIYTTYCAVWLWNFTHQQGVIKMAIPAHLFLKDDGGATHEITLLGSDGSEIGAWSAYNNVDSHATIRHIHNGTYEIQDRSAPHRHTSDPNGPYGSYGIIRFTVKERPWRYPTAPKKGQSVA
jgi:hypothetical protein